ncbi:hypothetical protein MASR1M12_00370 [Erysipelotrichia bacterium]
MGNSNFLGYAAGAYNYQEEKRRKDAEEALERQYKQMQLNSMRQRQAEFEYQKGRDRKRDEIEDVKLKIEKEKLDEARQSKMLAPIIKPYVPYLNRDTPGKSTLEVPLPNKVMGDVLSATGMPAIGLPGLPENAIPGQINFDNFLTGDEQSNLLKSQQKIAEKEAMIDFEVKKKRALADAGLIRDYNRAPTGTRSKSAGAKGSKKYDFYAEPAATASSINTKEPITAPTIQAFQPYKSYEEVLYRGTPEEQAAMSQLFEAENEKMKNSVQAQKNALALLNRSRKDSHAQTIAAAQEEQRKLKLQAQPKKPLSVDEMNVIFQAGAGVIPQTANLKPIDGATIALPSQPQNLPAPLPPVPQSTVQPQTDPTRADTIKSTIRQTLGRDPQEHELAALQQMLQANALTERRPTGQIISEWLDSIVRQYEHSVNNAPFFGAASKQIQQGPVLPPSSFDSMRYDFSNIKR